MRPDPQAARQFVRSIDINANKEDVWKALTDAGELRRWFPTEASVTPGVGGHICWEWQSVHQWPQAIEVWKPGRRLLTRYDSSVEDGRGGRLQLWMDFTLEGHGGRTTLRIVHSGFGPDAGFDNEFNGISRGWPVELESLRLYLERHRGVDRRLVWSQVSVDLPNAEAWRILTGVDGLGCGVEVERLAVGAPFRMRTVDGDEIAGIAACCQPQELCGVASSHGDAFVRFAVERCGGTVTQVWLWLATYGLPATNVSALQSRFDAMLGRLFAHCLVPAPMKSRVDA